MTGQPSPAGVFRPAPFPVYAPNPRPALAGIARRAAALLIAVLVLAPIVRDTGRAAGDGVQLAEVELGIREPVLLTCDFSLAGFRACPPELGAFTTGSQFLVSGEVPRGLLYGSLDGCPRIVLISYGEQALPEIDHLLATIRRKVDTMNDRRNMVRQAKQRRGPPPVDETGLPAWYWDPEPEMARASAFVELARELDGSELTEEQAVRRLALRSADSASLKRLYYSAQEARIDLLAAQFELQLALARSPEQDVPGMLTLGGSGAAREAMLTEVGRLSEAWRARLVKLESQANRDRAWLRTEQTTKPPSGWGVFSFIPGLRELDTALESTSPGAPGTPANRLEQGYREARLRIAEAEIDALESGLNRLTDLDRQVTGGPAVENVARRVALGSGLFISPVLEELPGYPALTQIVRRGDGALLQAQLAAEFAGISEGPEHLAATGSIPEVLYCLAAAELEAHLKPAGRESAAGGGEEAAGQSAAQLSAYEGFREFAAWYAGRLEPASD